MIKNQKGFSLVETVVAVIAFGIITVVLYSLFLGAWTRFEIELTRIDLAQEAAHIFRIIEEDVMESRDLSMQNGFLTLDFPPPVMRDDGQTPIFGPAPRGNFPEHQIQYGLGQNSLTRIGLTTNQNVVLSSRVDTNNTQFALEGGPNLNSRRVTVFLTLIDQVFRHSVSYEQVKDIIIRN